MISLKDKKIVLVENDQWQAEIFTRQLERAGAKVWYARDAASGLNEIDEHVPDIIVADLLLPGSTGLVLFHELQSHTDLAQIPIVVVSSAADSVSASRLSAYGVKRVLDKLTIAPDDLVVAVRGIIS